MTRRVAASEMRRCWRLLGITWKDKISNDEVKRQIQDLSGLWEPLGEIAHRRKLQWFGLVTRKPGKLAHTIMHGQVRGEKKTSRKTQEILTVRCHRMGIATWMREAYYRKTRRTAVESLKRPSGLREWRHVTWLQGSTKFSCSKCRGASFWPAAANCCDIPRTLWRTGECHRSKDRSSSIVFYIWCPRGYFDIVTHTELLSGKTIEGCRCCSKRVHVFCLFFLLLSFVCLFFFLFFFFFKNGTKKLLMCSYDHCPLALAVIVRKLNCSTKFFVGPDPLSESFCVCACVSSSDSMIYGIAAASYHTEQVAFSRDRPPTRWPDLMQARGNQADCSSSACEGNALWDVAVDNEEAI